MKMKEIKKNTDQELNNMIAEKREALRAFRFSMSGGKVKNVKEASTNKKAIAQMMTELSIRKNNK